MKTTMLALLLAMGLALFLSGTLSAQTRFGFRLDIGDAGRPVPYYADLGDNYRVPYDDVYELHQEGLCDDDIPAVLYIYTHSHYPLRHIATLRLRGASWDQLSAWCGVPMERYGYREYRRGGPPYGNAYGYYRHGPGSRGYSYGDDDGPKRHGRWRGENDDERGHHGRNGF